MGSIYPSMHLSRRVKISIIYDLKILIDPHVCDLNKIINFSKMFENVLHYAQTNTILIYTGEMLPCVSTFHGAFFCMHFSDNSIRDFM